MAVKLYFSGKIPEEAADGLPLLQAAAEAALGRKFKNGTVNIVYVGSRKIHQINKEFLGHDYVTDVISFNYPQPPVKLKNIPPEERSGIIESIILGEVYVCLPQAKRQAKKMGHSFFTEMLTLTVHGCLHVAGMDDSTHELRDEMNRKTTRILRKIAPENLPNWQ